MNKNKKRVIRQTDSLHVYETVVRSWLTFFAFYGRDISSRNIVQYRVSRPTIVSSTLFFKETTDTDENRLIKEKRERGVTCQTDFPFFFLLFSWKLCSIFINLFVSMNEIYLIVVQYRWRYVSHGSVSTLRTYFAYLFH